MGPTWNITVTVAIAPLAVAAVVLVSAALHDVAFRTVPNWIPAVLLVAGVVIQVMNGTLICGLLAGLLTFFGATVCWYRGWLGGGDVKLLAAATMVVPPTLAVALLLDVALAGGVLAILYLALSRMVTQPPGASRPRRLLGRICRVERYRISRRESLPYASAIAAGTFLVLFKG